MGSKAKTGDRPCACDWSFQFGIYKISATSDRRNRRAAGIALSLGRDWTKQVRLFRIRVEHLPGERNQFRKSERSQPVCALRDAVGGRAVQVWDPRILQ